MTQPSVDPLVTADWHFIGAELVDAASQTVGATLLPGDPTTGCQHSQEAAAAAAGAVGQSLVTACTGTTNLTLMTAGAAGVVIGVSACALPLLMRRWWWHRAANTAASTSGPPADALSVASQATQAEAEPIQENIAEVQDTTAALPMSETKQMKEIAYEQQAPEQPVSAPLLVVPSPPAVYSLPVRRVLALECPQAPLPLPPPPVVPTLVSTVAEQQPPLDPKPVEPPVAVSTASAASAMAASLRGNSEGDRLGLACGVAFLGLTALASSAVLGRQLWQRAQAPGRTIFVAKAAVSRIKAQSDGCAKVAIPLTSPHATPPLGLPAPPWAAVVAAQRLLPPSQPCKQPLLVGPPLRQPQQQQPWSSSFAGPSQPVQQDMGNIAVDVDFGVLRKSLPRPFRHQAETCVVDGVVRLPRPTSSRVFRILP